MKKNIIIGILSVVTCLSLVFAYMQKTAAEEARVQAIEARIQAEEAMLISKEQAEQARRNVEIAQMNMAKLVSDLAERKSINK